jgi:hypothetical protein
VHTGVSSTCRLARLVSGPRNWDDEAANSPGNGVHTETVAVEMVWPVKDQG